jgi:DNA mismatch repair protein MutS2
MDNHTIQVLEYEKGLSIIARYALTEAGRERVLALSPLVDTSQVTSRLKMISEMRVVREWGKTPPLADVEDLREAISRAKVPGAVLDARTVLRIGKLARTSRRVRSFYKEVKEKAPTLSELALGLNEASELEKKIDAAIDDDTNIKDGASPALRKIRREKGRLSAKIASSLQSILAKGNLQQHLQDSIVTIRNGRYVIPIRTEAKGKLEGIVHDTSQSGATVFIEPITTVKLNNQLRSLELEEKDEIYRILTALTAAIGERASDLIVNLELLTEIDVINAASRFSVEFDCTEPGTNAEGRTVIKGGRHPILIDMHKKETGPEPVPLDMSLAGKGHGVLITGPNAGGKTVALKTIGLITLLARTGLHVPCDDGTDIGLFDDIYADIGDEQSIELSLSTFSSHMRNIIGVLGRAGEGALVLLDEVGAGTDPFEGAALARTIIEDLLSKDATLVATTHHMSLKVFAHENPLLDNASMEFDSDNLKPTYRLIQGVPGASHAFEIASRLGLSDELLTRARGYCGKESVEFEELTRDLLEKMRGLSAEEAGIEAKQRKIDQVLAEYEKRLHEIKEHRTQIKQEALKEAKNVVDDAKRTVKKLVKELKDKEPDPKHARKVEQEIKEKAGSIDKAIEKIAEAGETRRPLKDIKVGTRAYVKPLSREGTVLTEPDSKGRVEVVVGALKAEVSAADLLEPEPKAGKGKGAGGAKDEGTKEDTRPGETPGTEKARLFEYEAKEIPVEIDVRGMTAEDAWETVDKYLDDVALYGYDSVRVIHGKGKGILSKRIREMLTSHPRVKRHRFGELAEGGTGVTVVEMDKG